jgi:hypothetical protein
MTSSSAGFERRLLARVVPYLTVERAAFFSSALLPTVVGLGLVRWLTEPDALGEGDVFGDFRGFYHAGELVRTGHSAELYDRLITITRGGDLAPPFMHPPAVALLFVPFSVLPYGAAMWLFAATSVAAWAVACHVAMREFKTASVRREVAIALRFAPVVYSLAYGQLTAVLALPLIAFVVSLRRSRDLAAGAALGLLAIKPQLALGLLVYLLLQRRLYAVLSSALVGGAVTAASYVLFPDAARRYASVSAEMFRWTRLASARPWSQIGFFRLGTNTLDPLSREAGTVVGAALTLAAFAWLVRVALPKEETASRPWDLALAVVIALSLALSPYLFHYDAGLFFVAFMLVEPRLRRPHVEPKRPYFSDARVNVAVFALATSLAVGPGLSELMNSWASSPLGLVPATVSLIYATYAVWRA